MHAAALRGCLALGAGAALATAAAQVPPGADSSRFPPVRVEERIGRYPVQARHLAQLREHMRLHRSGAPGGGDALTRSDIELASELAQAPGGCGLGRLDVVLRITTTLPEWTPPKDARPSDVRRWNAALAALEAHEAVHRAHARDAADAIRRGLLQLEGAPSCRRLRTEVNRVFQRGLLQLELRDRRFDARSRRAPDPATAL